MAIPGISGNRAFLPENVTSHVASFLNPENLASSIQHRIFRPNSVFPLGEEPMCKLIQDQYQKVFGQIQAEEPLDKEEMMRRIRYQAQKQPDVELNHNAYSVPDNYLERWKWIVGVENSLDRQVQKKYEASVSRIEQLSTTTILQLKNKMVAFWHADREVVDYIQFSSEEKARATSGVINQIFFSCLGFLFRLYYKSSSDLSQLNVGLERRSASTFATIGDFTLGNQEYDVVAWHPLGDHRHAEQLERECNRSLYDNETHRAFHSNNSGKTYVGIFTKEDGCRNPKRFGHRGDSHHCQVKIAMEAVERNAHLYYCEGFVGHGAVAVCSSKRHLFVGDSIEYRDGVNDIQGSDRELDRKLTQIMIEIADQNKVISLDATSHGGNFAVLAASGFCLPKDPPGSDVLQELNGFRATQGNKLFPSFKDYTTIWTGFNMEYFDQPNVSYLREGLKSWLEIIKEEPILTKGAAILPEYWAVKPNIQYS